MLLQKVFSLFPAIQISSNLIPHVKLDYGSFTGFIDTTGPIPVEKFLGIPYGSPPIGELRFSPPIFPNQSFGQYPALFYGKACPQEDLSSQAADALSIFGPLAQSLLNTTRVFTGVKRENTSEDCLNLNIERPVMTTSRSRLPVMVWLYGGAFSSGTAAYYPGNSLIQHSVSIGKPIIFVSLNYRLGPFGFLPGREAMSDNSVDSNAGLLDQRLALKWVQKYIAKFGGDPDRVTLFGESAGACSIGSHIISNDGDTENLFQAAILQSGGPIASEGPERGQWAFDIVASTCNCTESVDKIKCLRSAPSACISQAAMKGGTIFGPRSIALMFLPRPDGKYLRQNIFEAMENGRFSKNISLILGDQYDEGTILGLGLLKNLTTTEKLKGWLSSVLLPNASEEQLEKILELYPQDITAGSPFDTGIFNVITPQNKRINALLGDLAFQALRRFVSQGLQSQVKLWGYSNRAFRWAPLIGSFHSGDLLNVFGAVESAVTEEFMTRWIYFAYTFDPNVPLFPEWPQYGENSTLLEFNDLIIGHRIQEDDFREAQITYLNSIAGDLLL